MSLAEARRAIRPLLNFHSPADAAAVYYAFHHPEQRTMLTVYPPDGRPRGYLAQSRTGIDLFRPFVTLRLPAETAVATELIYEALPPETAVFLQAPITDRPLLHALFQVQTETELRLFALDPRRFEPVINVLAARSQGPNGLPRFLIRSGADDEVVASAHLNWQSPDFAEIAVHTTSGNRRQGWGKSVVAAMAQHLRENGRTPLYSAAANNNASIRLARSVGFVDTGADKILLQGALRPRSEISGG